MNPLVELLTSFRTQAEGMTQTTYVHEQRDEYVQSLRERFPGGLPLDSALRVRTRLDDLVEHLLVDRSIGLVVLTGDAGDGKTALCAELARRLGHALDMPQVEAGGWTIIKDASEIPESGSTNGSDLQTIVTRHLAAPRGTSRLLLAINEGRLRRLARTSVLGELGSAIVLPSLEALDEETARAVDARSREAGVLVLNFRQRFVVRELVRGFLEAWTPASAWEGGPCRSCPAREGCPILANAQALRAAGTRERVADALVAVYFTGQRLPVRRVQAVLALAVTGGTRCSDVIGGLAGASALERLERRFYDVLFTAPGGAARPEPLCATLHPFDPGLRSNREVDDAVALALGEADVAPRVLDQPLPQLETLALASVRDQAVANVDEHGRGIVDLGRAIRRWSWASLALPDVTAPAWEIARRLLEECAAATDAQRPAAARRLQEAVVEGLNRVMGQIGRKRDRISRHLVDPAGLREPARAGLEIHVGRELEVAIRMGPFVPDVASRWLETCRSDLVLEAFPYGSPEGARLALDLRLVEALLRVSRGDAPASVLGPDRRRIARFVSRLIDVCRKASAPPMVSIQPPGGRRWTLEVHDGDATTARLAIHQEGA